MAEIEHILDNLTHFHLKEQQRQILKNLALGNNVFGVLPTGYGKSVCYGFFGNLYNTMHPGEKPIVLVISPLKALMTDQVSIWLSHGVTAAAITKEMTQQTKKSILDGDVPLVFLSPECLIQGQWWAWIRKMRKRICLLAIDEVHCLTTWGKTFRDDYLKVPQIMCLLKCPVLFLTATVTEDLRKEVLAKMNLTDKDVVFISAVANRPNIHISMERCETNNMAKEFKGLVSDLKDHGRNAKKTIIYCRTIGAVAKGYMKMMKALGPKANVDGCAGGKGKILEMFHSHTSKRTQERILKSFKNPDSNLRCVIATVAFGLGVQVNDVRRVLHWGPAADVMSYWQEVGRCARDGLEGRAKLYIYPRSVHVKRIDKSMREMIAAVTGSDSECLRKKLLEYFFLPEMAREEIDAACNNPACCSVCDA